MSNNDQRTRKNAYQEEEEEEDVEIVLHLLRRRQTDVLVTAEQRKLEEFERQRRQKHGPTGKHSAEKRAVNGRVQQGRDEEVQADAAMDLEIAIAKTIVARATSSDHPVSSPTTREEDHITKSSFSSIPIGVPVSAPHTDGPELPGAYSQAPGRESERCDDLHFSILGREPRIGDSSSSSATRGEEEEDASDVADVEQPNPTTPPTRLGNEAETAELAVANPVSDEDDSGDLAVAQDVDLDASLVRKQKTRRIQCCIIVTIAIFPIALLVLLAVFVPPLVASSASPVATASALLPTQAPTVFLESQVLSLLPDNTLQALADESSPQSKAHTWLMNDIEHLPHLPNSRILQRFALAVFYFATNGEGWRFQNHWLDPNIHECFWQAKQYQNDGEKDFFLHAGRPGEESTLCGLPLNSTSKGVMESIDRPVMHLWLPRNNLKGGLPPELSLLEDLESIHLEMNDLEGNLPSEIGRLSSLRAVSCSVCGLSGTIPEALMKLTNLVALLMAKNKLTGTIPPELGGLTKLWTLQLHGNQLTGALPTTLGNLTNLVDLFLDTNPISGSIPTQFGALRTMEFLDLRDMELTGTIPTEIGTMTAMGILLLHSNALSGTLPSQLGLIEHVRGIALASNKLVGAIPSEMGQLWNLEALWLDDNRLTAAVPAELTQLSMNGTLHKLWLQDNELGGRLPDGLCHVKESGELFFDCNSQLCGCDCVC